MPFTELYAALEQKAVDGQETALPTIETSKFDEVQKYLTTTHHVYDPLVVLFSKKTWDKLSADEQKILTDAVKEATPYQRELNPRSPPFSRVPGSCDSRLATSAKLCGFLRTSAAIAWAFLRASSFSRSFGP